MKFLDPVSQSIADELIKNPPKNSLPGCYQEYMDKFGVKRDKVRSVYKRLKQKGLLKDHRHNLPEGEKFGTTMEVRDNQAVVKGFCPFQIKTQEELIEHCQIDTTKWKIIQWECSAWNSIHKDKQKNAHIHQLYRVYVKMVPNIIIGDLALQKEVLLEEFSQSAPRDYNERLEHYYSIRNKSLRSNRDLLFEPAIFDLHVGKLAWKEETGETYNSGEAVKRFVTANEVLLGRVDINRIERILLPLGNDMVHIDNKAGMTANGTPQDTDGRYYQMIRTTKHMVIDTIDKFLDIAPVDVMIIPGNHDYTTMFNIGEILDAWYRNTNMVNIFNAPTQRKFYQYGKVGLMFTHGDEEKIADLPQIFANSNKKLWYETEFRQIQLGHFHKRKQIQYLTMDSFPGVEVKIMSSLSGTDAYHARKGYSSPKKAEALMFHKDEGQVGEFFYNMSS
jgi:hypothetical protein